jgi:hypothetical protein
VVPDGAAALEPVILRDAAPNSRGRRITSSAELREIESLRAINAHLLRELAALKAREAETQRLAERDGLTGLYNRRRMLELLEAAISDAVLQDLHVGLLFIDLNGFKATPPAMIFSPPWRLAFRPACAPATSAAAMAAMNSW